MEKSIPFVFFFICIFIFQSAEQANVRRGMKMQTKTELAASRLHTLSESGREMPALFYL